MMQPVFSTPRLTLRPRQPADTEACLAMDREPEVLRFIDGPWSDPLLHRQFIEARTAGPWAAGLGYWTILDGNDTGLFLGWILLVPLDAQGPEIEIGWRLRRAAWGRGVATEAAAPILQHALASLQLTEVIADIAVENTGSRRVAEKLGMVATLEHISHGRVSLRYVAYRDRPNPHDGPA